MSVDFFLDNFCLFFILLLHFLYIFSNFFKLILDRFKLRCFWLLYRFKNGEVGYSDPML